MTQTTLAEILESADRLSLEEQEDLIGILKNRIRDRRRGDIIRDVREAEKEFAEGKCQPVTPQELMKEIIG